MSYKLRVCGIDVFSFDFKTLNLRQFFNLLSIRLSSFRLFNHKRHIRKTKETRFTADAQIFFATNDTNYLEFLKNLLSLRLFHLILRHSTFDRF